MTDFKWYDFLEIGVDFIDNDHRELLDIIVEIKQAIDNGEKDKCVPLFSSLLQHTKEHFSREEEFLLKVKYPNLEKHKNYHEKLLLKADETKRKCEEIDTQQDLKECFDMMATFLIDDILRGDIEFKSYLEYEGYLANS